MNAEDLFRLHKSEWLDLEALLEQADRRTSTLSPQAIQKLSILYRLASADLALAQRDFPNSQLANYLNQLVGRGHAILYRSEPLALNRINRFVLSGFPQTFRHLLPFFLISFAMFSIPALIAGICTDLAPSSARWLLPQSAQDLIPMIQEKQLWVNIPTVERPFTSSFIMTNNIQVSFIAFAGGITAGLLTTWALIQNGLIIGGLLGLTSHYGLGWDLATFIVGHGVLELSVIFMSGGAGLSLAWAILRPGLFKRSSVVANAGKLAVKLLCGAAPLLVVAGVIEGFLSPAENIQTWFKWCVGISSGILLYTYLFFAGKEQSKDKNRL